VDTGRRLNRPPKGYNEGLISYECLTLVLSMAETVENAYRKDTILRGEKTDYECERKGKKRESENF